MIVSWEKDKTIVFPFLLTQADQGDLEAAKNVEKYNEDQGFRKAIDDALPKAPVAGSRHASLLQEAVKIGIKTLNDVIATGEWIGKSLGSSLHHTLTIGEAEGRQNVIK